MLERLQKVLYPVNIWEARQNMAQDKSRINREGYLYENYRYFHLHDTAGQERSFHYHDFDKIVILKSGRVDYIVEDVTYALTPWSVLLVKNHAIHKALIDKSEPYDRIIIYLNHSYFQSLMPGSGMMDCFENASGPEKCLLLPGEEEIRELSEAAESYERMLSDERFGAETVRETEIIRILIYISRFSRSADNGRETLPASCDRKIAAALAYINENLRSELSVDTLAGSVFLSKYHFMRLFKEQTGSTVHAYIREKRLLYAARLIREGIPAVQASQESGFTDYSTFSRAFHDCFDIRPSEIKK